MIEEGHLSHLAELDVINLINSSDDFQASFRLDTKDLTNIILIGKLFAMGRGAGHFKKYVYLQEEYK